VTTSDDKARAAAASIWSAWERGQRLEQLPASCRPATLVEGYAAQAMLEAVSGCASRGWKIAATNVSGQRHIGVDGPIGGRLLADKLMRRGASAVPIADNLMRVAEAEFAFVLGADLPARDRLYSPAEVLACVADLHPAIELPDSRFQDFAAAGGAQLAADNACAGWFMLGDAAAADWRAMDLAAHPVSLIINARQVSAGHGADVLGGPLLALAWLANSHRLRGCGLSAGDIVTTGVCGRPCAVQPGDSVCADFGALGQITLTLAD
jgi:2-keto-4-pentenoate hydratase